MNLPSPHIGVKSTILLFFLLSPNPTSRILSHAFLHTPRPYSHAARYTLCFQSKEPLAREGDWAAFLDEETTGLVYYFNTVTGESVWNAPTATFPKISMSKRKKEKMLVKRREYFETQQQIQQQKEEGEKISNKLSESKNSKLLGGLLSNISVKDKLLGNPSTTRSMEVELSNTNADNLSTRMNESTDEFIKSKNVGIGGLFDRFFTKESTLAEAPMDNKEEDMQPSISLDKPELPVDIRTNSKSNNFMNRFFSNTSTKKITSKEEPTTENDSTPDITPTNQSIEDLSNGLNLRDFQNSLNEESTSTSSATEPPKKAFNADMTKFFRTSTKDTMEQQQQQPQQDSLAITKTELQIEMISKVLPHPDKLSWGGEDAVFCSNRCFGVFDGVSGADKEDGKPLYSITIANQLKESLEAREGLSINQLKSELMDASLFADTCATGATTALVASIGMDGFLRVINLGDSVLMVIRNDKILVKTREKIHYFDCPYQLSNGSPDRPRDATTLQVELLPGDIIVAGSDGVFDNLTESTVRKIVSSILGGIATVNSSTSVKVNLGLIAKKIVDQSRSVSLDPEAKTPYALMAKQNRYQKYESGLGGKLDDISCIVARCT